MIRNDIFSVWFASLYLFVYCLLLQFDSTKDIGIIMLFSSPLIVGWMVYTVLKHGKYNGPELGEDEFGYQDKPKEKLKTF